MSDKPFLTWHDRDDFVLGDLYVADPGVTLEFVGVVSARIAQRLCTGIRNHHHHAWLIGQQVNDENEAVMLFIEIEGDVLDEAPIFWTHTLDEDQRFTFEALADRVLDDSEE